MRFNDAVFGVLLILFAIAVWAYSGGFPEMPGQAYGPALFPRLIAFGLALCGIGLCVSGARTRAAGGWVQMGDWAFDRRRLINTLLIPAGLLSYVAFSDAVGFLPIAFALLSLLLWRYGTRPLPSLILAAVTALAVHTLFYRLLHVPLPWGILEPYAW